MVGDIQVDQFHLASALHLHWEFLRMSFSGGKLHVDAGGLVDSPEAVELDPACDRGADLAARFRQHEGATQSIRNDVFLGERRFDASAVNACAGRRVRPRSDGCGNSVHRSPAQMNPAPANDED